MAGQSVTFLLQAKDQASAALKAVQANTVSLSSKVYLAKEAFNAVATVTGTFVDVVGDLISVSAEQSKIFARLDFQLQQVGTSYAEAKEDIDAFLDVQQRTTQFGDTQTAQMLQRLVTITGVYEGSLERVALAQDIMAIAGKGEEEALNLVAKAVTGNLAALGEVLPKAQLLAKEMDKNATNAEKADAAWKLLTTTFRGAAAASGDVTTAISRTNNAWVDLKELIGDATLKVFGFERGIETLAETLEDTVNLFKGNRTDGGLKVFDLGTVAQDIERFKAAALAAGDATFAVTERQFAYEEQAVSLRKELEFLNNYELANLGIIFDKQNALIAVEKVLARYWKAEEEVNKTLKKRAEAQAALTGTPDAKHPKANATATGVVAAFRQAFAQAETVNEQLAQAHAERLMQAFTMGIRGGIDEYVEEITTVDRVTLAMLEQQQGFADQVGNTLMQGLSSLVSGVGQMFGNLLATGQFSMDAFGGMILQVIGQVASAFGAMFLSVGFGIEALKTLNGAAAIAAGIGLLAFGGILSGLGAGLRGGGGGSSASAPVSTPNMSDFRAQERDERREETRVVFVNTSGSDDGLIGAFIGALNRGAEQGHRLDPRLAGAT